jgi:nitrogen fixation protein NifU and related proteins
MTDDLYLQQLLEEARAPRNVGKLDDPDFIVSEFNAGCGDRVELTLRLTPDKKNIQGVAWQGTGCIISQAGLSILSEKIKGMAVEKIQSLEVAELLEWMGLDSITPGRIKCVTLGLSAVKKGVAKC